MCRVLGAGADRNGKAPQHISNLHTIAQPGGERGEVWPQFIGFPLDRCPLCRSEEINFDLGRCETAGGAKRQRTSSVVQREFRREREKMTPNALPIEP